MELEIFSLLRLKGVVGIPLLTDFTSKDLGFLGFYRRAKLSGRGVVLCVSIAFLVEPPNHTSCDWGTQRGRGLICL